MAKKRKTCVAHHPRAPSPGRSFIYKKDNTRNLPPKPNSARFKINRPNLKLYQCGLKGSPIPELTLKDCLYKDYMYIHRYFDYLTPTQCHHKYDAYRPVGNTDIYGLISIYHGEESRVVPMCEFKEYNSYGAMAECRGLMSTKKTYEDIDGYVETDGWIENDSGELYKDTYAESQRGEHPSGGTSFHRYRKDFIKCVSRKKTTIRSRKPGLLEFFTEKSQYFTQWYMPKVYQGFCVFHPGYYFKCNCCHAITYLPITDWVKTPTFPATRDQVCDVLEIFQNDDRDPVFKRLKFDMSLWGGWLNSIGDFFDSCGFSCYNCGLDVDASTALLPFVQCVTDLVVNDYDIGAINIEIFKQCLLLDRPPPQELLKSNVTLEKKVNDEIATILKRANKMFLNLSYSADHYFTSLNAKEYQSVHFATKQPLLSNNLSCFEVEEMVLISEFASLCNGVVNVEPSSINVLHAVHSVLNFTLTSGWFDCIDTTGFKPSFEPDAPKLRFAHPLFDFEQLSDVIDITTNPVNATTYWIVPLLDTLQHDQIDGNVVLTPVTGSNLPVEWSRVLSALASLHSGVMIKGKPFIIKNVRMTEHMGIIALVPSTIADMRNNSRVMRGKSKIKVLLPKLSLEALQCTMGIVGTNFEMQEIDVELCTRIFINALSGQKSIEGLLTYISGLTSTRYVVGGKTVDLSSLNLKEGIPELTYVLVVLSDEKRTMSWLSNMYFGNVNVFNSTKTVYNGLLRLLMQGIKVLEPKLFDSINKFVTTNTELLFQRDNCLIKSRCTMNINDILPYKVINSSIRFNQPKGTTCSMCCHHSHDCAHKPGENWCRCCNILMDTMDKYCGCCKQENRKLKHSCYHKCTDKHECELKKANGFCNHANICPCCECISCEDRCSCCYSEPVIEEVKNVKPREPWKPSVVTQPVTNEPKPTQVKIPSSNETVVMPKPFKVFKENVGARINKVTFDDKTHKVRNIRDIINTNELFISSSEGLHCLYMPELGIRTLRVKLIEPEMIANTVPVSKWCAYHCLNIITGVPLNELINNFGEKDSHSVCQ
jgi:hypothetical protein